LELDLSGCSELGCLPYLVVDYREGVKKYSIDILPFKWRKTICLGTYKMVHEATRTFDASIF
jgi:hypothetical protein